MGRVAGWAVRLPVTCSLWQLGRSQWPGWSYWGLEAPLGETQDPSQIPGGFAQNSQELLSYASWLIVTMLGVIVVSSIGLFLQRFLRAQQNAGKEEMATRRADPEEASLVEALHLLDAVMENIGRHLHRLERGRQRYRRRMQTPGKVE